MSDKTDIVYRLRHDCMSLIADEAADVIERLRKELDARIAMCDMRSEKIIELTAERDEARREVCRDEAMLRLQRNRVHRESEEVVLKAKEISVEYGWDCFNTPKPKVDKTLKGVIVDGGKAVPPKYEDLDNG